MSPQPHYKTKANSPTLFLLACLLSSSIPASAQAERDSRLDRTRHDPILPYPTPMPPHIMQHGTDELSQSTNSDGVRDNRRGANAQEPLRNPNLQVRSKTLPGKRDQPPTFPQYTPLVTPPPDQDAALASLGYKQVTFYTCHTIGQNEHCGWHVPVVKAQGVKRESGVAWIIVGCFAGVFAVGLM